MKKWETANLVSLKEAQTVLNWILNQVVPDRGACHSTILPSSETFHASMKKPSIGQALAFYLAEPYQIVLVGHLVLNLDLFSCKLAANLRILVPRFVQISQPYIFTFT